MILLQEIPWTWENISQKILQQDNDGRRFSLIVVAEGADHITVAWGRDYSDVTSLRGIYTGDGRHSPDVSVDVVAL